MRSGSLVQGVLRSRRSITEPPITLLGRHWAHHRVSPLGSLHAGFRGLRCHVPATVDALELQAWDGGARAISCPLLGGPLLEPTARQSSRRAGRAWSQQEVIMMARVALSLPGCFPTLG